MHTLNDLKRLAGLTEARQIMDPDEEDRLDDEKSTRQQKIVRLITLAFQRLGLTIEEGDWTSYYVIYDESDREAIVKLDDSEVDLAQLMKLYKTGLSQKFSISVFSGSLAVSFIVAPEMDHAIE